MARNATSKIKIAVEFELDPEDHEVLSGAAPAGGFAGFLKSCIEAYLHEYSNGGLMLSGPEVAQLSKAAKSEISSSTDIIKLIDQAGKSSRGLRTFQITLDPSLVDSFQQNADFKGMSVDELIQECWSHIHANGWLYQMMPDVFWVPLNEKTVGEIKKATKAETVTSDAVLEMLRKAAA
jgi:hypothetical protein